MSTVKRLRKRKLESNGDEGTSKESKAEIDRFTEFFNGEVDSVKSSLIQDMKDRSKNSKKFNLPQIGSSIYYKGVKSFDVENQNCETGWSEALESNMEALFDDEEDEAAEIRRKSFLNLTSNYLDYLAISDDQDTYRTVFCAHIVSHIIANKNLVISNKKKLDIANAAGTASEEFIESCRDSGFVRPTVLILCPFKKDAYDIVNRMRKIIYGEEEGDVFNKKRFEEEFTGPTEVPENLKRYPADFIELMTGNNDDSFRCGIALGKKTLKLYEKFSNSDILVCSPLGLRMILNGEEGSEAHLISSIHITVIDRMDVMLQQNWENVMLVMSHLNMQPTKIDVDISRVRKLYLDGHAKHFSQLMAFSRYSHELFTSLVMNNSQNHRGLVISKPKLEGTLNKIEVPLCQEIHKFTCSDPKEVSNTRFNYFLDKIVGSLAPRTLIVVPSYFDYVRIRNHFKRAEESFVTCHEYAPKKKIDRARDMFYHQRKNYLIATERWYFFNRKNISGCHRIVFYQLPSHPLFYSAFINMSDQETSQRLLAVLLVCKYDKLRMENTFGTKMATAILNNPNNIQAIVSE